MILGDLAVCESSLDFQILLDFEIFRSFTKPFEAQTRLLVSFRLILLINSKLIYMDTYLIFLKLCPLKKVSGKTELSPGFKIS